MKVKLYTSEGIMNRTFVHEAEIPPFVTGPPQVILWGIRVFRLTDTRTDGYCYTETFAYALP
jgi:hypothetical protein